MPAARAWAGRSMRPVKHVRHGEQRPRLPQPARGAVEAGDDAELHLGQAEPRAVLAVRDAIVAGERELQAAAEAKAVDRGHGRNGQLLDAVENRRSPAWMTSVTSASVLRLSNSRISAPAMKLFSLPDMKIRPRSRLSRAPSSTAVTIASSSSTGSRPSVFCDWPWTSMMAQAMPLEIDLELPMLQVCDIRCHDRSFNISKPLRLNRHREAL